mmetsp:Transcript_7653/g.10870  ORF Transcript_7653/g.10870 Transcript_7653/m.10870 type:complete len:561 (+) Transcript_7653:1557-3239(+)
MLVKKCYRESIKNIKINLSKKTIMTISYLSFIKLWQLDYSKNKLLLTLKIGTKTKGITTMNMRKSIYNFVNIDYKNSIHYIYQLNNNPCFLSSKVKFINLKNGFGHFDDQRKPLFNLTFFHINKNRLMKMFFTYGSSNNLGILYNVKNNSKVFNFKLKLENTTLNSFAIRSCIFSRCSNFVFLGNSSTSILKIDTNSLTLSGRYFCKLCSNNDDNLNAPVNLFITKNNLILTGLFFKLGIVIWDLTNYQCRKIIKFTHLIVNGYFTSSKSYAFLTIFSSYVVKLNTKSYSITTFKPDIFDIICSIEVDLKTKIFYNIQLNGIIRVYTFSRRSKKIIQVLDINNFITSRFLCMQSLSYATMSYIKPYLNYRIDKVYKGLSNIEKFPKTNSRLTINAYVNKKKGVQSNTIAYINIKINNLNCYSNILEIFVSYLYKKHKDKERVKKFNYLTYFKHLDVVMKRKNTINVFSIFKCIYSFTKENIINIDKKIIIILISLIQNQVKGSNLNCCIKLFIILSPLFFLRYYKNSIICFLIRICFLVTSHCINRLAAKAWLIENLNND